MFSLAQFASVKVQPKVHSEFGELTQEVERQNLVTIRVGEDADKALDSTAFVYNAPQKIPVGFEHSCQVPQKGDQLSILNDFKGVRPVTELPPTFTGHAFGSRLGLTHSRRAAGGLQSQRPRNQVRINVRVADV